VNRRRAVEGAVVAVLLLASLALFASSRAALSTVASVDLPVFALAVATTLAGLAFWSESLAALLRVQGYRPRPRRFLVVFLAGTGLRGLVPGGSSSGPAVLAYLVARTTDVPGETSAAMAYVAEVCLWIGSAVVATTGMVALLLFGRPTADVLGLAGALVVLATVVFGLLVYGAFRPTRIERRLRGAVRRLHDAVEPRSARLAEALDPDGVEASLDRFFGSLRQLAADPRRASPAVGAAVAGWFVHATTLYVVLLAVDVRASYAAALFVVPVGGLAEGLSILPGGVGSVEPGLIALLVLLTPVDLPTATVAVLLYRLSNYWFRVVLGFLALSLLGLGDLAGRAVES